MKQLRHKVVYPKRLLLKIRIFGLYDITHEEIFYLYNSPCRTD